MKACIDCAFYEKPTIYNEGRCGHKSNAKPYTEINFVTGKSYSGVRYKWDFASTCRLDKGWFFNFLMNQCGQSGRYWKPK
jgi:hypothetical protein